MTGIIGAMDIEVNNICAAMTDKQTVNINGTQFYKGKINGRDAVVAQSGVGKVNAAIVATRMTDSFPLKEIISVGVAGGVQVDTFDIVVAKQTVQYDFDMTAFGKPLGTLDERNSPYFDCSERLVKEFTELAGKMGKTYAGVAASGDAFVYKKQTAEFLKREFNALSCDMESAAIAQACEKSGIEFVSIRVISDRVGNNNVSDYEQFKTEAAKFNSLLIEEYFKSLK